MAERPVVLHPVEVRAVLERRKTQMRRPVRTRKPIIGHVNDWSGDAEVGDVAIYHGELVRLCESNGRDKRDTGWLTPRAYPCPYGAPGDTLWVRETLWRNGGYVATQPPPFAHAGKVSAMRLRRWESRLTLRIKSVRVEQLQEISGLDAMAEGVLFDADLPMVGPCEADAGGLIEGFGKFWDSINKKAHSWASNPWCWVVEFELETCRG